MPGSSERWRAHEHWSRGSASRGSAGGAGRQGNRARSAGGAAQPNRGLRGPARAGARRCRRRAVPSGPTRNGAAGGPSPARSRFSTLQPISRPNSPRASSSCRATAPWRNRDRGAGCGGDRQAARRGGCRRAQCDAALVATPPRCRSGACGARRALRVRWHRCPIAIKDNIVTAEQPTTCGSRILEGYTSPYTATAVDRLRAAGAIIAAKANMDEFAMGSSTEHSAFGRVRHPLDPDRVPGGSSGGSAALVAAGVVPAALGSETGGSVRQPASFCGVVGVKPSYGRVSRFGLVAFGSSLDCISVFGRTVDDATRVLSVMSGADPLDATTLDRPPMPMPAPRQDLRGLRVGLPREYFPADLHAGVTAALQRTREAISIWAPRCATFRFRIRRSPCRPTTSSLRRRLPPTSLASTACDMARERSDREATSARCTRPLAAKDSGPRSGAAFWSARTC